MSLLRSTLVIKKIRGALEGSMIYPRLCQTPHSRLWRAGHRAEHQTFPTALTDRRHVGKESRWVKPNRRKKRNQIFLVTAWNICTDLFILFWDGVRCVNKWKLDTREEICRSGLNYGGICDLVTSIITFSVSANLHAEKLDTLTWNKWKLASLSLRSKAAFWASGWGVEHRTRWVADFIFYTTVSTLSYLSHLKVQVRVCFHGFCSTWPSLRLVSSSISWVVTLLEQLLTLHMVSKPCPLSHSGCCPVKPILATQANAKLAHWSEITCPIHILDRRRRTAAPAITNAHYFVWGETTV